ncbi:MAG: N-acetylneuraminate synthase family protein, partial [Magnetococcales bacterium]|nr:N-acetylneuraminate synthase family protein [Magnetococcales bacterium]
AIKFQTYKAATLASRHAPAYWDTEKEPTSSQFELFKKYDSFWKREYEQLKLYCDHAGIEFMSTPFDMESAQFLNDLMGVYKISSSDITNRPFIEHMTSYGKPILLSTGASHLYEIQEAVGWIRPSGVPLALMHCILNYPTAFENANLGMIHDLRRHFPGIPIGYSDHTPPGEMDVLETAALMGASVLEKHFTHDKTLPGNDHYHAMNREDLKKFRKMMARRTLLMGASHKAPLASETPARQHARRSLVAVSNIAAGERIGRQRLTFKRPAHGVSPRYMDVAAGMVAAVDIEEDTVIKWEHLRES